MKLFLSAEILLFSFLLWPFFESTLKLLNFELHMTSFYWTNNYCYNHIY